MNESRRRFRQKGGALHMVRRANVCKCQTVSHGYYEFCGVTSLARSIVPPPLSGRLGLATGDRHRV